MIGVNSNHRNVEDVNNLLPWHTKSKLSNGRTIGRSPNPNKRNYFEEIPDKRITQLHEIIDLSDKSILELGCLEGSHTLGLLTYAKKVTSIDCRPVNVIKTLTRLSFNGKSSPVYCFNAEDLTIDTYGKYDVIFHCGVLYHLKEPIPHLENIFKMSDCIFLDTHVTEDNNKTIPEDGWRAPFAGKDDVATWLSISNLKKICSDNNFNINMLNKRQERNGLRITWLLQKNNG